jgi:MEDS: MEthanogen/methylotroph, DcmR Sensory domain
VLSGGGREHVVLLHATERELADRVCEHFLAGEEPGTAIVIATPEHRRLITERLAQAGVDVPAEWAKGSFVALDAGETMDSFIVEGWPDAAAFWQTISPVLKRAIARPGQVRVFGEMVAMLWDNGQTGAAVDLEALWNELARQYSFSLLCAYPADALEDEHSDELAQICAAHSAILHGASRT